MNIRGALFILGIALLQASGKEIFRYEDTETGQAHFMEGQPGVSVSGGWEFSAPEGDSFKMNYAADENGYQPQGDHLPVHVVDTEEVKNAKTQFYAAFEEKSNELEALNGKRVERAAEGENMKEKPGHYAPFYGYFPRQWSPKMKESVEKMQKHQMELKDLREKYIKKRHETLEKLGKHPAYPYFNVYYYPQHLIPDMKISEEELSKIQADLKEVDEKYMKEMQEKVDELKEDFPYYPNFYPPITHFPVNEIDAKEEDETMPKVVPKYFPFHHYSYPHYYLYSHKVMEHGEKAEKDAMDMKSGISPKYNPHFPYHYGYTFPKPVEQEKVEVEKEMTVEEIEKSRRKRSEETVVQPAFTYATYYPTYYPANAVYYPSAVSSKINSVSLNSPKVSKVSSGTTLRYHPSLAQVTRTVVKLPEAPLSTVDDNTIEAEEALITSDNSEEESEPESEPEDVAEEAEPETAPEVAPEGEAVPEQEPVSNEVASSTGEKSSSQIIQRPSGFPFNPAQSVLKPDVANTRPAFHPHWGTRMTILPGTQFYPFPRFPYQVSTTVCKDCKVNQNVKPKLASPVKEYSTFPVHEKDLSLAAIVA